MLPKAGDGQPKLWCSSGHGSEHKSQDTFICSTFIFNGNIFAERIHVKYLRNDLKTGKGTIWYKQNRQDNYLHTQEKEQIKDFFF